MILESLILRLFPDGATIVYMYNELNLYSGQRNIVSNREKNNKEYPFN